VPEPEPEPQFDTFGTAWDHYHEGLLPILPGSLALPEFYDAICKGTLHAVSGADDMIGSSIGFFIERAWYMLGEPQFKVYPAILDALVNTHVEIDAAHLKLPFGTFLVRFPKGHYRERPGAPYVRSMLVTTVVEPPTLPGAGGAPTKHFPGGTIVDASAPRSAWSQKLVLFACFEAQSSDIDAQFNYFKFPLVPGKTIRETFEATKTREETDTVPASKTYWPSRVCYDALLKIAVGTAFFGIGRDREEGGVVRAERLTGRERKAISRKTGEPKGGVSRPCFSVGRDLVLPSHEFPEARGPVVHAAEAVCAACAHRHDTHIERGGGCSTGLCGCAEFDSGRHLTTGHIRSGHLHWYRTGSRKAEEGTYTIKWIAPTVVRPDLPLVPVRTRAIKPPSGRIVSVDMARVEPAGETS